MKTQDEIWEKDRCKLKENKESKPNQVSSSDSVGGNDETVTNNNASSSVVEIKKRQGR